MLKLWNTFGKRMETFEPTNKEVVNIFTCGPSIYQRAHIGNFRTFLFEDVLVRYLEYLGYSVKRGMNFTDIEDKAIKEAMKRRKSLKRMTDENIHEFIDDLHRLKMKTPDYLPRASESVEEAVEIIERLLDAKVAYWHRGNVYFDPLQVPRFGELYGLDMARWPTARRRFHQDTYPGSRWNLGDFVLWHGHSKADDAYWETRIGRGRPSWNIQDPSMISKHFNETLSIYCGGLDNLIRHHDYTKAILESIRPYPMARYWLHCHHLYVDGQKMSKSKGNVYDVDDLMEFGYDINQVRFFLIYGHYRRRLHYSNRNMRAAADRLQRFRDTVLRIKAKADQSDHADGGLGEKLTEIFMGHMDDDLNVKKVFDGLSKEIAKVNPSDVNPAQASGIVIHLERIDSVLRVIF